jgi:LCP family protein required for cell wall assembly
VSKYFKPDWKLIGFGFVLGVLIAVGFFAWRAGSFVSNTTGGGRTEGFLPTPTASATTLENGTTNYSQTFSTPVAEAQTVNLATTPLPSPTTGATISPSDPVLVQKIKRGEPVTVMLAGYGGNGRAGEWLTDTILVLRYDPKTKTVVQLNIPRDLYVYVPYGGKDNGKWSKINTILPTIMDWSAPNQDALDRRYRWTDDRKKFDSGINLIADTVETVIGMRIDYWATMSFEGFRRFIDAMGGVDVTVERYFIDRKYPRNDNDQIDAGYKTVEFYPGRQRLSGERAIQYARSRFSETIGETGDFARSKRQMTLIGAVRTQVLRDNLVLKAFDYMQALEGKIRFSLDFNELVGLANYFNTADGKSILANLKFESLVLNDRFLEDTTIGDAYVLVPVEGQGKYAAIQRWLRFGLAGTVAKSDNLKIQVLNGNGQVGIASKFTDFLVEQGFYMLQEQDGENRPDTVVFDYTQGKATDTLDRLKAYLPGLKVMSVPPSQRPKNAPPDVDLQLCLGKDFKLTAIAGASGR